MNFLTFSFEQNETNREIRLADEYSASFLIKHECSLDHQTNGRRETPLHLLSSFRPKQVSSKVIDDVCLLTELILQHGADANQKDSQGNTCLHRAILADNISVFKILLTVPDLLLDEKNRDDHLPLWFALQQAEQLGLIIRKNRNLLSAYFLFLSTKRFRFSTGNVC